MRKVNIRRRRPARTARSMLRLIDDFLQSGGSEQARLWDVLSALRGPDSQSYAEKRIYTIPIRYAAFPRTARRGGGVIPASFGKYRRPTYGPLPNRYNSHFLNHIRRAALILGLEKE